MQRTAHRIDCSRYKPLDSGRLGSSVKIIPPSFGYDVLCDYVACSDVGIGLAVRKLAEQITCVWA